MIITEIKVNKIQDSRGADTIEVLLTNDTNLSAKASVPKGKSTGGREAMSLGPIKALENAEKILKEIKDIDFNSIRELDEKIINLDGTEDKSNLGGDLILGISIAFARILGKEKNKDLWEILQEEFFMENSGTKKMPYIFANMINGGEHAEDNLAFQEYIVLADTQNKIAKTKEDLVKFYEKLGQKLKARNQDAELKLGDEAGYCADFENSKEPFTILQEIIKEGFESKNWRLASDIAANSFYDNSEKYIIDDEEMSDASLLTYYRKLFEERPLLYSIEDPFEENDTKAFLELNHIFGRDMIIMGDDLTTTNPKSIEKYKDMINAVIIKANQIGSVTETMEAIKVANKHNMKTVISHRSGETDDCFLVHIARASNAYGVKIGPPARERLLKYEELERIY